MDRRSAKSVDILRIPDLPAARLLKKSSQVFPIGDMIPIPVMATRLIYASWRSFGDMLLDRQPLNDADHILQGIERHFAIGDLDVKFLFKGEQEFNLVQRIKTDALDGGFRTEPFFRKFVVIKKQFFDAFPGFHRASISSVHK